MVLFHHGNAETLRSCLPFLQEVHRELQCSVFALDYPGYGASGGAPTEASVLAAARAAYDHVTGTLKFAPADVVLVGWSLGSGPAVDLAATVAPDVSALVLLSPFRSCASVMLGRSVGTLDMFDNEAKVARVRCPLLVIHGTLDRVVPFSHGVALAAVATAQRGHADGRVTNFVEATQYGHDVKQWSGLYVAVGDFLNNTETRN